MKYAFKPIPNIRLILYIKFLFDLILLGLSLPIRNVMFVLELIACINNLQTRISHSQWW